jgi:hypothetical protein
VNAADLYREAAGLYTQFTPGEKDILFNRAPQPDPAQAEALHGALQPIMALLKSARKADYSYWGPAPVSLALDSARSADFTGRQDLSHVTHWEASYVFPGDPAGAVEDLAAQEAIGRSDVPNLLGLLVQAGIHMNAMKLLEKNAASIPSGAAGDISYIVDPAAAERIFEKGMDGEASIIQLRLKEYADPATRDGSYLQKLITDRRDIDPDPKKVISEIEWLAEMERALAPTFTEPEAQFQQWWKRKVLEAAAMPVANGALKAVEMVTSRARIAAVETAMLDAGLALEWNNEARLKTTIDPSTGKPFTWTKTAGGFEIDSPMLNPYARKPPASPAPDPFAPLEGGDPMKLVIPSPAAN